MGLLCLTTPIPLVLKEHPGWVGGAGGVGWGVGGGKWGVGFSALWLFSGDRGQMLGYRKRGFRVECRCCRGAASGLMRATRSDSVSL